ncbi:hypothetical protein V6N11_012981 [Hibiscus sabdariffa]|uniref:DUF4220 domain-containing protein n=1 Tax=Hibiscus sabdariffa TaxID=183260 RepID=A0ABR1ZZU3_9ROSI
MTICTVAFSLVYVEIKNWAVGKIPSTQELRKVWSEWEVRCLVVLSLVLQLLLILSAYARQRYKGRFLPYVAAIVWSIYLAADWLATLSMTTILRSTFAEESAVVVLWVPFLLWHLGSPANITAYSLEDNELWLRHFLGLLSNGVEAVYIYIKFRTAGAPIYGSLYVLDLMVVTLLVGGILKYAERIVALRSASSEQLRNDLYSVAKRSQQRGGEMIRTGLYESSPTVKTEMDRDPQVTFLRQAQESFEIFRPLFLDLQFEVSNKYHKDRVFLRNKSAEQAYRLVNIELHFLYDLFYTKNPIQHRYCELNAILRGFYMFSTLSALILFTTRNNIGGTSKRELSKVDITVTYLLLAGATSLDAFAALMHLRSYWTMIRFGKQHKLHCWPVASKLRTIESESRMPKIAQYDVLKDFAFKPWPRIFEPLVNFIDTNDVLSKYRLTTWTEVDKNLKKFIYDGLEKELGGTLSCNVPETLLVKDLDASLWPYLEHRKGENKDMPTSLTRAIFICHVTTKLIYYSAEPPDSSLLSRMSNILSDYMLFLVLVHPSMLPKDFDDMSKESFVPDNKRADLIRKESRRAAILFGVAREFERSQIADTKFFARQLLANERTEISELWVLKELDVLSMGHKFARKLRDSCNDGDIWGLLSNLWMIMLIHAAKQCSWKEHAVALRNGAELLTHVSLLLAHFGLSHHIRVQDDIQNGSV